MRLLGVGSVQKAERWPYVYQVRDIAACDLGGLREKGFVGLRVQWTRGAKRTETRWGELAAARVDFSETLMLVCRLRKSGASFKPKPSQIKLAGARTDGTYCTLGTCSVDLSRLVNLEEAELNPAMMLNLPLAMRAAVSRLAQPAIHLTLTARLIKPFEPEVHERSASVAGSCASMRSLGSSDAEAQRDWDSDAEQPRSPDGGLSESARGAGPRERHPDGAPPAQPAVRAGAAPGQQAGELGPGCLLSAQPERLGTRAQEQPCGRAREGAAAEVPPAHKQQPPAEQLVAGAGAETGAGSAALDERLASQLAGALRELSAREAQASEAQARQRAAEVRADEAEARAALLEAQLDAFLAVHRAQAERCARAAASGARGPASPWWGVGGRPAAPQVEALKARLAAVSAERDRLHTQLQQRTGSSAAGEPPAS